MVVGIYSNFNYLFQKVKPYFKDIIDNEYVLDVSLGVSIFMIIIFLFYFFC